MKISLKKGKKKIYMDHAAATPVDSAVFDAMKPYFSTVYANPSALHKSGVASRNAIEAARKSVAKALQTEPYTITFTAGSTEGNNMAVLGLARKHASIGKHIISARTEHQSVLQPLAQLEREGFEITYVPVDNAGRVTVNDIVAVIRPDTTLITLMYANNEIGTVTPIAEIGKAVLKHRKQNKSQYPYFHTDATQAINYLDINVERLHVDIMTFNAAKIYGPKGVGAMYKRKGVEIEPIVFGGGHEDGLRSGTENTPAIVGLAASLEMVRKDWEKESDRLADLQALFMKKLSETFPDMLMNGPEVGADRLPNNIHGSFAGLEGEQIALYLDAEGVECSTTSACESEKGSASHVLAACGISQDMATGAVRFTLGRSTTQNEVETAVTAVEKVIRKIK